MDGERYVLTATCAYADDAGGSEVEADHPNEHVGVRQPPSQLHSTPSESPRAPAQNHPACAASRRSLQEQYEEEITHIDVAAHARSSGTAAGSGQSSIHLWAKHPRVVPLMDL